MSTAINPAPLLLILATAAGVLVHDMNIDKASVAVMALPASASYASKVSIHKMEHVHVERGSIPKVANQHTSSLPKVNPPRDDDRKYAQNKKGALFSGGGSQGTLWPSV